MSSTSEWLHFHQNNPSNNNPESLLGHVAPSYSAMSPPDNFFSGLVSEATVVSTVPPDPPQLGPAGRVTKPVRRRTRASRRTPTTLLNTDTTNFRAMVQQFTGGPSNSFGPAPQGYNIGPGHGYGMQFPMGQVPYGTATTMSSSSNTTNRNSNIMNDNMYMQRNMMVDNNNNNINYNAYLTNNTGSNNNNVNGGSSSSDNRSGNNFPF